MGPCGRGAGDVGDAVGAQRHHPGVPPQVVTYLASCGLQSCPMLLSKGYPDIGWNPCGGERYLDFLRFAVFVNGQTPLLPPAPHLHPSSQCPPGPQTSILPPPSQRRPDPKSAPLLSIPASYMGSPHPTSPTQPRVPISPPRVPIPVPVGPFCPHPGTPELG